MSKHQDDVLRALWTAQEATEIVAEIEVAAPPKVCKRMSDVSFDGMAAPGSDLGTAWRDLLRREGKLTDSGGSVRDLVLGPDRE